MHSEAPALVRWWSLIGVGESVLSLIRGVDPTVTFGIYSANVLLAIFANFALLLLANFLTFAYVNMSFMLKVTRLRWLGGSWMWMGVAVCGWMCLFGSLMLVCVSVCVCFQEEL